MDTETPALENALRQDFADLPASEQKRLSYFKSPSELFAEFFAERYARTMRPTARLDSTS